MTTHDLAVLIERMEAATADARDVIREAHATTKDLRFVVKEAHDLLDKDIKKRVVGIVERAVESELKALGELTVEAMDRSTQKVVHEFDKLKAILLGTAADGKPTIPELIDQLTKVRNP